MSFDPMSSVNEMEMAIQNLADMPSGCIYGTHGDPDLLPKGQLLYLTLWEHGVGRELAADHDVEMVESADDVLRLHASREQEFNWILACWQHEALRPFFDVLGLKVKE